MHALIERKWRSMPRNKLRLAQLEQEIRHNIVICMKQLQRSQTLVLACLLFSETSEIILSTFEGVFHCHSCAAK